MTEGVKIAFERKVVSVAMDRLLPTRALPPGLHETVKYRRIAASVSEVGLIEPLSVARQKDGAYLLLDGHVRLDALRAQGAVEAACIVANDDESFTYNKRVNRLSPVQEQRMIAKAIERKVPKEKIARALDINVRSVSRKVQLLDGLCEEAITLLKDKMCPLAVFDVMRKMNPLRQIEAAELLVNANNFSVSYASAILAGTPQAQLATPQTPKRLKGMTAEAILL